MSHPVPKIARTPLLTKLLAIIGVLAILAGIYWVSPLPKPGESKVSHQSTTVSESFEHIAELAVEEYSFTNVGKSDEEGLRLLNVTVPLTGKSFLITYDGVVKAGLPDATTIEPKYDDAARKVSFDIPKPEVLSANIDQNSIQVYDQSMNPFNPNEVSDYAKFIAAEEARATDKAIAGGLLTRAEEQLTNLIEAQAKLYLEQSGKTDYQVEVRFH
ncbi:DUF4230 domain-containing protein [Corynebacterium sp. H127]|uniref:DUF4230 domain-containing protein n=1 Tax=Corynebacterium sp. H127 TaxID=3133418 RepID=UPI00309E0754